METHATKQQKYKLTTRSNGQTGDEIRDMGSNLNDC